MLRVDPLSSMATRTPVNREMNDIKRGETAVEPATIKSLAEFLTQIVFRSQCWCFASLAERSGFRVGASDTILFYTVIKGSVTVSSPSGPVMRMESGDVV